ncbi:MAG: hypothetical protein EAY75_08650 [Bacteroidetes bacterium]|nr:MAG: hypothetical protein EAY75_08650 [Bacteroidota bacterium]
MKGGFILIGLCFAAPLWGLAQATLILRTQPTALKPGATLLLEATYQNPGVKTPKYSTLHIAIEAADQRLQWQLRYPLVDGLATAAIALPDSLPKGVYVLRAKVQREMVHVLGRVKGKKPPPVINALAMKGKEMVFAKPVNVDADGYFQLQNLLFEERATLVFTPIDKSKNNWLDVEVETPVDSSFYAFAECTLRLPVGVPATDTLTAGASGPKTADNGNTLQNVVVTGKAKTNLDKFADRYVSGFFLGNGYTFDGIDDQQLSTALTVFDFLIGRVPGLNILRNGTDVEPNVTWRDAEPAYFVDEIQTDLQGILSISTPDIAMVKVMRPPFFGVIMGGAGGAIAVYTKREGSNYGTYGNRFKFVITGYTPQLYKLVL